jgi:hypothetical protein
MSNETKNSSCNKSSIKNTFYTLLLLLLTLFPPPVYTKESSRESSNLDVPYKHHRFLLITGCARSGTTYISEVLKLSGLDIGHELVGKDGVSSWFMCIEADHVPWKHRPSAIGFHFDHIFHQVRHPLKVISSVLGTEHRKAIDYFSKNIPEIYAKDSPIVKSAKYWYYWNLYAEQKAEWRYQVEHINECLEEMGQRLGISLDKAILQNVPRDTNHRKATTNLTWAHLKEEIPTNLFINIQEMALRYGYSISD